MRILIVNDDFPPESRGGAGVVAATLARGLLHEGHSVFVASTTRSRSSVGEKLFDGIPVMRWYAKPRGYLMRTYRSICNPILAYRLARHIAVVKPDIIHIHNVHQYFSYTAIALAARRARTVVTLHDMMSVHLGKVFPKGTSGKLEYDTGLAVQFRDFGKSFNPFRNLIVRRLLATAHARVCVSRAQKTELERNHLSCLDVVYNPIDVNLWDSYPDRGNAFRQKYGLSHKRVVWFGGRVGYEKGIWELIRAAQLTRRIYPDTSLFLAGGLRFMEIVRRNVSDADEWIVASDWLNGADLKDSYCASDIVATPSVCFDTFIVNNLEAQINTRPVVTTVYGGAPETILEGETGYAINPFNTDAFAFVLIQLLGNSEMRRRMGLQGRELVMERFDLRKIIKEYMEIYLPKPKGRSSCVAS